MEGGGGCCTATYAGGGADNEKMMMERVMLKFRPIAPKPATGAGSAFGSSSSDNNTSSGETKTYVKAGSRGKRKYTAANNNKRRSCYGGRRKRVRASQDDTSSRGQISSAGVTEGSVTLPLLPESPITDQNNNNNDKTSTSRTAHPAPPICWLSFNSPQKQSASVVVESVVTVECVTDMWASGEGLGRTDEERLRNLEWDTCPGFITDGERRAKWINRAYKKMVLVGDDHQVVVWVEMKDDKFVQGATHPAFTCRVRVHQKGTKEIKILPCDVWRMDCGGFAWRLDVKAALSLGR